ncbi:MAG: CitMHS family transporter [Rhodospirillaceae bacterium]
MMLSALGFLMVAAFMILIMTKRMAPIVALIVVPVAFGLLAGFGGQLGPMMLDGITRMVSTGVMLMFAILYFGIVTDAGLFDPVVRTLLKIVDNDPVKVVVGSVVLAAMVSLDGDGSTTYMITAAAFMPLYRRIGLNPMIMACLLLCASGIMNIIPWGGPTARAATALQIDSSGVFIPLVPAMAVGLAWLVVLAIYLGRQERKRLGALSLPAEAHPALDGATFSVSTDPAMCRPRLVYVNAALTLILMVLLVMAVLPLPVLFMCGFAVAAILNYPQPAVLKTRVAQHAPNVLAVVSLIFAAGIFTGILSGTGMVEAMSKSLLAVIPPSLGPYLAPITGIISIPMTFFISNDAFYFGMLPVLAEAASHYGLSAQQMASAALVGQPVHLLSPLVPSTWLLAGLAGVDFGEYQKFTLKWATATSVVLLIAGLLFGAFPLRAG